MRARHGLISVAALLMLAWAMLAQAQRGGGGLTMPPVPGSLPGHKFEKVAEGVYFSTATGSMEPGSNGAVIVNADDVLIVDPGITPAMARAFIADVKTLTTKPIKYVVDTHYHYDHAFGNQVFGPDVTLIGHDMTRRHLLANVMQQRTYLTNGSGAIAAKFTRLRDEIAKATDPQQKSILQRQLAIHQQYADEQKAIKPTPPTTTLTNDLTLHRGGREIQIRFMGRAHTDGDVVVFLPQEKIVATGDMVTGGLSYTGDAFVQEWPATLEKLNSLDFDTVMPGHGAVFKGKDHIKNLQAYWRDFYTQASDFCKRGVAPEEAAKQIDLSKHAAAIPAVPKTPGVDVRGVDRVCDLMKNPNSPVR